MKKLILPILLISTFMATLLILPGNTLAFFHDKGSELELDCYDTFVDAVKGSANWGDTAGGVFIYNSDPKTISKNQGENFCLLSKVQMFDESRIFDKHELKISYVPELPSLIDKFNVLKSSEEGDFEIKDNSENEYSGRTARGEPLREDIRNYARQVNILGNCLIEFTYRADRTPAMHDDMGFAKTLADAVLETVKTYQVPMLNSEKLQSFCGGKAPDSPSSNQKTQQAKPQQSQSDQSTKERKPSQDANPVQPINDWIKDTFSDLDFDAIEAERLYGRTPEMTEEIIQQYQAEQKALYEGPIESPYRLDIQNGDIAIKLPGQTEWSTLKQGDRIPSGSTIFTGMDSTTVLSIRDKGIIQVQSFTEITVTEKGLEEAAKTGQTYTDIELRTGEVELNVPGGVFTGSLQVHTPNSTTGVRGTHFWVSYDKDKKLSTTGVYKGEVEVTAKGSDQFVLVSPNGDKPGVVVVAQKLSPIKLAIAGVVLVAVIGGVVFLKKRGLKLSSPKKKSSR